MKLEACMPLPRRSPPRIFGLSRLHDRCYDWRQVNHPGISLREVGVMEVWKACGGKLFLSGHEVCGAEVFNNALWKELLSNM